MRISDWSSDVCSSDLLVLTAQGALQDRVRGLNLCADDFLTKPFALEELEARLAALVRRSRGRQAPRMHCGSLIYDSESRAFGQNGRASCRERVSRYG